MNRCNASQQSNLCSLRLLFKFGMPDNSQRNRNPSTSKSPMLDTMKQQPPTQSPQSSPGDDTATATNSSIIEFLNNEQQCLNADNESELDIDSIFEEINRLSDESDGRSVDEILREAELLLSKQEQYELESGNGSEIVSDSEPVSYNLLDRWKIDSHLKTISEESTPREMRLQDSSNSSDECEQKPSASTKEKANEEQVQEQTDNETTIDTKKKKQSKKPKRELDENTKIKRSGSASHYLLSAAGEQSITTSCKNDEAPVTTTLRKSNSMCVATGVASPPTPVSLSASNSFSWSRERALEQQIESLREILKDTEERLQSLRLQYDNVSQMHRALRDTNNHIQEEMDRLKIDAQHLNECTNILRTELQAARKDRNEAIEMQKLLQRELDECRLERRKASEEAESANRQILDLQRQCREMERILARKNPDTMSGLIVGNSKKAANDQAAIAAGRRMLEQRIAQLENDAKEQDRKAQIILTNVQSRFSSVQSKYETHISDLETQVLSLQQINQVLNEKISTQEKLVSPNNNYFFGQQSFGTQTDSCVEKCDAFTQADFKIAPGTTETAKASTTVNSKKTTTAAISNGPSPKEQAQLLATVRSMRVDLAIKEKAMQRLTRELDECKKSMKKLQSERDATQKTTKKTYDPSAFSEPNGESTRLQDSLNKIKMMETDYKALHDKRLQDLKTLQLAHERELSSNKETIRLLEQRLAERDEAFAIIQKHHKIPIDYFALKAKVTSLERRHTEREQRLHVLIEALSKGRHSNLFEQSLSEGA